MEFISQLVNDLSLSELQFILDAVKPNETGDLPLLRQRVLHMLSPNSPNYTSLKQKIVQVYNSRLQQTHPSQHGSSQPRSIDFVQRNLNYPYVDNSVHPSETSPNPTVEFGELPFFKPLQTLLKPLYCSTSTNLANFTGLFTVKDYFRNVIEKSWNKRRQEFTIQIVLRLVQVGLEKNATERLPYNLKVTVNDCLCSLPTLNIPTKAGITPWRCNVPIDITQQTDIRGYVQNKIEITWSDEPYLYMAGVFMAQKFSWEELVEQLNKRPRCPSNKTKESIKNSMENDADLGVDSMFTSIKDPLSKTRMQLPARGMDCKHLQCFDAIQFLQMNELKQTWKCPLCKENVKFENIEVDEFFLNILKSPNLSEECENVILLADGSWSEKQNKEFQNTSKTNNQPSTSNIEVFTLSNSDDEDPPIKRSKNRPSIIQSRHIINVDNVTKNDLVLDLTRKNKTNKPQEKEKSGNVICVITLD